MAEITERRREQLRAADARYRKTEKGRARDRRYLTSEKHREAVRAYRATTKGILAEARADLSRARKALSEAEVSS